MARSSLSLLESSSTLECQSQNWRQNRRLLSPKTLTYGVFYREFGFDSHEWVCSLLTSCSPVHSWGRTRAACGWLLCMSTPYHTSTWHWTTAAWLMALHSPACSRPHECVCVCVCVFVYVCVCLCLCVCVWRAGVCAKVFVYICIAPMRWSAFV